MVGLKLFQLDRNARSRPSTSPEYAPDESYFGTESPREPHFDPGHLYPAPPSPALPSPVLKAGQSLDVSHHFEQIEKQFEDLHQHLGQRPLSSQCSLAPNVPGHRPVQRASNCRHIDLMAAVATRERYQQEPTTPSPISPPASPYNEDVAERNMTRFLRIQHRNGFANSRILSALYQEDVADRNIAKYAAPTRSLSALSSRSSPPAPGRVRKLSPDAQKRNPRKPNWTSDGDLRNRSSPDDAASRASDSSNHLRLQKSAPSLHAEADDAADEEAPSPVIQRLGVPPAYKQGRRWSNTPLPDSPTLPPPLSGGNEVESDNGSKPETPPPVLQPPSPTARSSSLGLRSISPPPSSGSSSKRNVRDLSINTRLASKGRSKIGHCAIQPPTPSSSDKKRAPSIAEVMNSPLPVQTPTSAAPSPRFKVSEMMDLFNKAYMSTHALSPHPTYESLQDAIVREINSHDAFKRVPVPAAAGPLFTPSDVDSSAKSARPALNRSASAGQFSKIMRKGSFKKHKRDSESSRSISTSVSSKGYDRLFRKVSGSPTRRRHTDAPAPSPNLLADLQRSKESTVPQTASEDQLTYMDVLMRAGKDQSGTKIHAASTPNITATRSSTPVSSAYGTVYCMQAHSTPSKDSRSSMSVEDSDDDIIHLPSIGTSPPRVQIEGVDENNVRYVIDGATATDAQTLMSWPQRLRRAHPPQSFCENSLSPLSRARMQLRGARSVETY
ncbi:hypothetical protein N7466_002050 [Penicillium verhagenii]|uniref:uncharacterized protein n=1 Tax=Penicillium verhagenii TaxID=1562060 RepID=UPI002545234D|nr:uncharacterized protein N7466_002050 [Penicillium verhagenii]KAJ5938916.1 hypothetical protein N7466_002050 [Penicillium verhagenii]